MSGGVYKVITPPSQEPITLTDAKAWMRIDFGDDDSVITNLIARARSYAETVTGRAWATQQIQEVFTIERPLGGELSGPINRGPSWYSYNQQIGANPFGAAQFYYDLAVPPIQSSQPVTIETKVVAFDTWKVFPQVTNPDGSTNTYIDNVQEPARLYVMDPITSNFWRFTYWAGYDSTQSYTLPGDLKECLFELVSFFYDNREAEDLPSALMAKLVAKRVASAWI